MRSRIVRVYHDATERAYYGHVRIPVWVAHWLCEEDEWPTVEDVAGGIALGALGIVLLVLVGVL